jgi:hypothetical protein
MISRENTTYNIVETPCQLLILQRINVNNM